MKFSSLIGLLLIGAFVVLICFIGIGIAQPRSRKSIADPEKRSVGDIRNLYDALTRYRTLCGAYPTGANAAILNQLRGDNAAKIRFMIVDPKSLNDAREFIDPWGTAYAIEFPSTNAVTIASAGKDRKFMTADDFVFNSPTNAP